MANRMEFITEKAANESGNTLRELFESITKLSATAFPDKDLNAIQELFNRIEGRPFREGVEKVATEIKNFLLIACFLSPHIAFLRRPEEERHAVKEAFLHGTLEDIQKATSSAFLDAVRIITNANKFALERESKQEVLAGFDEDVQDYETKVLALLDGETEPRIPEILALPVFFVLHGILPDSPHRLDDREDKDLRSILKYCQVQAESSMTLAELIKGYKAIPAEVQHYNKGNVVYPNSKMMNATLRNASVINANETVESSFSAKNEALFTEITATNEKYPDLKNFNFFQKMVYGAVCRVYIDARKAQNIIWDAELRKPLDEVIRFNAADIWKILTKNTKASKNIAQKIDEVIRTFKTTHLYMSDSAEMAKVRQTKTKLDNTSPTTGNEKVFAREEYLLEAREVLWRTENNSVANGWELLLPPLILRDAESLTQIIDFSEDFARIPMKNEDTGKRYEKCYQVNEMRVAVAGYLEHRILTMPHMNSNKILIESIYKECGINTQNKKETELCREWIFICLDWQKEKGAIADYKRETHGRKLYAIEITLPIDESKQIATKKATKKKKERAVQ